MAVRFVSNFLGSSGPIQGKNLQLPFDRNGRWHIADGFVASLILKLSRNREYFPILTERAPELRPGVHFHILADAERSIEDGHLLLDRGQIEGVGRRVNCGVRLHMRYRLTAGPNRFISM